MLKRTLSLSIALFLALSCITALYSNEKVSAVTAADWRPGRIIDDSIFTAKDGMSVVEIQSFLNNKVGTGGYDSVAGQCDTNGARNAQPFSGSTRAQYAASLGRPTVFTCLNNYYEVPKTSPGPGTPANNYGGKPIPAGAKSAAQLIWDAAQQYNINPKVLLVTIQKESAGPLTTDDWPFEKQYTYAMGAHCPDSGPGGSANCDSNYAGFSIQISESASLFRWYLDSMSQPWWPYKKPGNNSVLYNPNTGCGSSNVYIQTMATAALYTYTPYQPNQAALNNMYGLGDGCSAYGNRNFWRIYNDWFEPTIRDLVSVPGSGVYLLENGFKRGIPNEETFLSYSYKWSDVVPITYVEFDQIPTGTVVPYNVNFRNWQLVKTSGSTGVYLVYNGTKRGFPNQETFLSHGYKWSDIVTISNLELGLIPVGTDMPYNPNFRNWQLVKTSGSTGVYLVYNGTKRGFPNQETFLSHGYKWSDIVTISNLELGLIPVGTDMPYNPNYNPNQ